MFRRKKKDMPELKELQVPEFSNWDKKSVEVFTCTPDVRLKYREEESIQEALEYIKSTYGSHYSKGAEGKLQLMDLFFTEPVGLEFSRGAAIKYLWRYGKKAGYNKKDLFKAIHYILFMLYLLKEEENKELTDCEA